MESLEALKGRVVTDKHGREYSLNMSDMACIQNKVPLPDDRRPFVEKIDVVRFCYSYQGVDIALEQASKKHDTSVTIGVIQSTLTDDERFELIDKIIAAHLGVRRPEGGDQDQPPLENPQETGS